jgi:hypothetical protein
MGTHQIPEPLDGPRTSSYRDRRPRDGILHGPSKGLEVWADWLIYVHRRWHEGDSKAGRHLAFGVGGWLLALVTIIEKAVGG